jgi:hypothetical protein
VKPVCHTIGLTIAAFYDFLARRVRTTGISEHTTSWELLLRYRLAVTLDELRPFELSHASDINAMTIFVQSAEGHEVLFTTSDCIGKITMLARTLRAGRCRGLSDRFAWSLFPWILI